MTGDNSGEPITILARLATVAAPMGLHLRGGFSVREDDGVPPLADGRPAASVVLLGHVGGSIWPAFAASPEAADGSANPLDRWSRRVLDALADSFGAVALYPFGGPPYLPFQRWALRAEPVTPSPLGILIHAEYGLWHGYRGALALAESIAFPPIRTAAGPCAGCETKPCLDACPVGAFTGDRFLVDSCRDHLERPAGHECRDGGCRARAACPVGQTHIYPAEQIRFHMAAFRRPGKSPVADPAED
jgi:ferredoxin